MPADIVEHGRPEPRALGMLHSRDESRPYWRRYPTLCVRVRARHTPGEASQSEFTLKSVRLALRQRNHDAEDEEHGEARADQYQSPVACRFHLCYSFLHYWMWCHMGCLVGRHYLYALITIMPGEKFPDSSRMAAWHCNLGCIMRVPRITYCVILHR